MVDIEQATQKHQQVVRKSSNRNMDAKQFNQRLRSKPLLQGSNICKFNKRKLSGKDILLIETSKLKDARERLATLFKPKGKL